MRDAYFFSEDVIQGTTTGRNQWQREIHWRQRTAEDTWAAFGKHKTCLLWARVYCIRGLQCLTHVQKEGLFLHVVVCGGYFAFRIRSTLVFRRLHGGKDRGHSQSGKNLNILCIKYIRLNKELLELWINGWRLYEGCLSIKSTWSTFEKTWACSRKS